MSSPLISALSTRRCPRTPSRAASRSARCRPTRGARARAEAGRPQPLAVRIGSLTPERHVVACAGLLGDARPVLTRPRRGRRVGRRPRLAERPGWRAGRSGGRLGSAGRLGSRAPGAEPPGGDAERQDQKDGDGHRDRQVGPVARRRLGGRGRLVVDPRAGVQLRLGLGEPPRGRARSLPGGFVRPALLVGLAVDPAWRSRTRSSGWAAEARACPVPRAAASVATAPRPRWRGPRRTVRAAGGCAAWSCLPPVGGCGISVRRGGGTARSPRRAGFALAGVRLYCPFGKGLCRCGSSATVRVGGW